MNFGMAASVRREQESLHPSPDWLFLLGGVLPEDDKTYVEEVWAFSTNNISAWNKTELTLKRASHCVAQIGERVYIIGGVGDPKDSTFRELNITSLMWNDTLAVSPASQTIFPACTPLVTKKEKWIAVFGGSTEAGVLTNNISLYNLMNNSWSTFKSDEKFGPPASEGSTLTNVVHTDQNTNKASPYLVVLGGSPLNHNQTLLYVFNYTTLSWAKPVPVPIPALAYHTTISTKDGNLVVFGGLTMDNQLNSDTYVIEYEPMNSHVNVTRLDGNNMTDPVARRGHAALFEFNRMLVYGGNVEGAEETPGDVWQFVIEKECLEYNTSCGRCLLGGCYFCDPNITDDHKDSYCVAGKRHPFIGSSCTKPGWNTNDIKMCRPDKKAPLALTISTIVSVVVIFILVVAVYFVDFKKGKATSGGYEPIGGM